MNPAIGNNPVNSNIAVASASVVAASGEDIGLPPPREPHERSVSQTFEQDQFNLYVQPFLKGKQPAESMSVEQVALMDRFE